MTPSLPTDLLERISRVLSRHAKVQHAVLFGSRAKGTAQESSDFDIAVFGALSALEAERIAGELDEEIIVPQQFDVVAYERIRLQDLREHIDRVGITIYRRDAAVQASSPKTARA